MQNEAHLKTTPEAAQILSLGTSTLEKWRLFGGGPRFLKLGRSVRYAKADLDDWIQANRQTSTSDYKRAVPEVKNAL